MACVNLVLKSVLHHLVIPVQVPGPAPNLQAVSITPTSVTLTWERPVTGNGEIQNYKLYYTEKGQDSEQVRSVQILDCML